MVKTINEAFDDVDYNVMKEKKGKLSWHDYMMGPCLNVESEDLD